MPAIGNTHERMTLPEGAVVAIEVEVVGYMEPDEAEMKWGLRCNAEAPTSSVVGLLEMAKADLILDAAGRSE